MTIFRLSEEIIDFPPPWLARPDGLLCVGGDLLFERLILAYRKGIFPWYGRNEPILWWCPDPRLVLFPEQIHVSRSLKKKIRQGHFTATMDKAFEDVIYACADSRTGRGEETWLVDDMIHAYIELHERGYAHSVESWKDGALAGGLYGVSLGGAFFGESMFTYISDASKFALVTLSDYLAGRNFDFIDCQLTTQHMVRMGASEVSRKTFLKLLNTALEKKDMVGEWHI